ncbi:hypothetical protein LLY41_14300 [Cytobacillus firmus]|uniref:hypothetical protein n=1 Tax=Cytobacillus firmus TaxID=1399 RepID=UPI00218934F2|nr:hypothetical protein [Cytobacillus firmus]URM31589.1 hypothetical protein LLY41_14300 [Cytobacillus firmus]
MDKKTIVKFIVYISLIAILFPVIINCLMFVNIFPVAGDEKTWISSLGTFWGAIIGGVVSGTLTLIGVKISVEGSFKGIRKTIEHQEKENFKENIGLKLNKLYSVKKVIYHLDRMLSSRSYGWNENNIKDDPKKIDEAIVKYIVPKFNELLEISSSVDWEFYNEIKVFVDKARKNIFSFEPDDLDELKGVVDKLTEVIEYEHENRLIEKFKKVSSI